MFLLLQMNAQPAPLPMAVSSTSDNHNDKETPSPLPASVQTRGPSSHPSVFGYTLHPMRVCDAKNGVKDG